MTEIRALLGAAAGEPQTGDLLGRVRRVAARRRRIRRAAATAASLIVLAAVGTVSVRTIDAGHRIGPAVLGPSPVPTASPTQVASPKPTATPGPAAPIITAAACTPGNLTAGPATQLHFLAGEDGIDLPLTAIAGCTLSVTKLHLAPDAAVPVTPSDRAPLGIGAGSTVHLVLSGESDGFCSSTPDAHALTVSLGGSRLATVTLPSLGLCTGITAALQPAPDHGGETSCTAAQLTVGATSMDFAEVATVSVTLRNSSDYDCFLQGTPTAASAVTATGSTVNLDVPAGMIDSHSLAPGGSLRLDVSSPGDGTCQAGILPVRRDTFTRLRLTLLNAGGAVVTAVPDAPFSFPCGQVSITFGTAP